ncbi:S8 family peptidase [Carboxylicivirga sp. M1479]|uniref:S8 family peptidase n=1 Tax=Carboxylicivirga sp. M1479 TaxID=2594476 RepID=UPI001177D63A|nr:S8 family peptidase [Carboxylicivirga sp. M1479]TRX66406.1 S8 family peptidase [Carboxylicivirga sp. M1479]
MTRPHFYLNNTIRTVVKFPKRGFIPPKEEEDRSIDPLKYENKKQTFSTCLNSFSEDLRQRQVNRTIDINEHVDYVKIYFHGVFTKDLREKYEAIYGLVAVKYEELNHTVLLAINERSKFELWKEHINTFANREEGDIELDESSYLLVYINNFELLKSSDIIKGFSNQSVLIELIDNTVISSSIHNITTSLLQYLSELKGRNSDFTYSLEENHSFISIQNAPDDLISLLAANFDNIYKIQSHTYKVKPSSFGVRQTIAGFTVNENKAAPLIAVIDTGVEQNSVLKNTIVNYNYDLTNNGNPLPIIDSNGHGTGIAGLIALGTSFFDNNQSQFTSDANIVPIKVIDDSEGVYSLIELETIIRDAAQNGVKLFNLSMTSTTSKLYNEIVSEYAFLLDKLAYELDVLFFLAAGNLGYEDMQEMQRVSDPLHTYPNHFYNPNKVSFEHECECCNINSPAESYNNLTIGAIAENFNVNDSDLTHSKELPSYYTKKYHADYSKVINGYHISKSLINKNIHKPDVVFAGGDAILNSAGMEVLTTRSGLLSERSYGTSNSAPLVTNIAAKIKKGYPNINTQSIKALIINSASLNYNSEFLSPIINELKLKYSIDNFRKTSLNTLTNKQKALLSKLYNKDRLLKFLTGHGVPNEEYALSSNDNCVTLVIENTIKLNSHKGLVITLPKFLEELSKRPRKNTLRITATLCYSFMPIFNNALAYCPLHISFALFKPLNNDLETSIDILAGYTTHEKANDPDKKALWEYAKQVREYKNSVTWSEDYYPLEKKPSSNSQKIDFSVSSPHIIDKGNKLNLLVRCDCKKNIDPSILERLKREEHKYSIVLRIEEQEVDGMLSNQLYDEIQLVNELSALNAIDLEAELE